MERRILVRLLVAASTFAGPRVDASGTDDAVTRLKNAETELGRDVITAEDRARYSVDAARAALGLGRFEVAGKHAARALEALQYSQRDTATWSTALIWCSATWLSPKETLSVRCANSPWRGRRQAPLS
jgi:hypothetical protein